MAHHWIFINSAGYRRFIQATNERKGLLFTSALGLAGASLALGYAVINFTNPDYEQEGYKSKQAELSKLPMHSQVVAKNNREQLRAMLLDVTSGTDKARYKDLLDGKIHGTRHGTSMPDAPK